MNIEEEANRYSREGAIPSNVRGHYQREEEGSSSWVLLPRNTVQKPYVGQHVLPRRFRIEGQNVVPLTEEGGWDPRFPPTIRTIQVGHERIGRGHIVHTLEGPDRPREGTLYIFAPLPNERIVELVCDPGDIKSVKRSAERIASMRSYGDPDLQAKYFRETDVQAFRYTPMNDELPQWVAKLA